MQSVEVLILGEESVIGTATLKANVIGAREAGLNVRVTERYQGGADWLCLYGVGEAKRNAARLAQIKAGGRVACWDLGYVNPGKDVSKSYVRVSVDYNHPHRLMDATPNDPARWNMHGIKLREDADPNGHIVVVGMGPKSRRHLGVHDWELKALRSVQARFPDKRVLYRPKRDDPHVPWEPRDGTSPIEDVLRGASLAVCRHSNVAIDACIAGVPVHCEDGAALWLYMRGATPNRQERLDFLCRVAHWQYRGSEMAQAWQFVKGVIECR